MKSSRVWPAAIGTPMSYVSKMSCFASAGFASRRMTVVPSGAFRLNRTSPL